MSSNRFRQYVIDPVIAGMNPSNSIFIPNPLERVNKVYNYHKARYILIGGNTGSGKTAFVDSSMILEPYDWWRNNRDKVSIKPHWIYWSMERRKEYKLAKWTCYKLYKDYGILMDVDTMLGYREGKKVSNMLALKIAACEEYFEEMLDYVEIIDGPQSPDTMASKVMQLAAQKGTTNTDTNGNTTYTPNDQDDYTFLVADHIGKTMASGYKDKKAAIDAASQVISVGRDLYGFGAIVVSQFNRAIGDSQRMSIFKNDLAPILEDFKESGNTQEDADLVLALFNPYRYKAWNKEGNYLGYPIRDQMISPKGENRFRSLSILKNSYGLDDMVYGLKFLGECGHFKTLPRSDDFFNLDAELDIINQGF